MSGTVYHRNLTHADVHIVYAFLYADESSRLLADGFTSADVGKLARVISPDDVLYMLISHSPPTWTKVGGAIEPATDTRLGGVRIQSTGGLYVDTVGNLSLSAELLNKLNNLPDNIMLTLANTDSASGLVGGMRIGFGGHSATYFAVQKKPYENALQDIINKISTNTFDISVLQTSTVPIAKTTTLGTVKVPENGGLAIDLLGNISLSPTFYSRLSSLPTDLALKASLSDLTSAIGSDMIGYKGNLSTVPGAFSVSSGTIEDTLDAIVTTMRGMSGSSPATTTTLGGIKVGDGLAITTDGLLSVVGGGGGASSFLQLTDVPDSYGTTTADAYKLVRVNANRNGVEFVDPQSIFDQYNTGMSTDKNFVYRVKLTIDANGNITTSSGDFPTGWQIDNNAADGFITITTNFNYKLYNYSIFRYDVGSTTAIYLPIATDSSRIEGVVRGSTVNNFTVLDITGFAANRILEFYFSFWKEDVESAAVTNIYTIGVEQLTATSPLVTRPPEFSAASFSGGDLIITHNKGVKPYSYSIFINDVYVPIISKFYGILKNENNNTCRIDGVRVDQGGTGTYISTVTGSMDATITSFTVKLFFKSEINEV